MINLQSILSLFDDKPTLLKWLKKVEAALAASVLTSVGVEQAGEDVTLTFNFEDGTKIVAPAFKFNKQITAANIENGHLIFTFADGSTEDAGNLFNSNISVNGQIEAQSITTPEIAVSTIGERASGQGVEFVSDLKVSSLTSNNSEISAKKPVVEVMQGYSFLPTSSESVVRNYIYAGACKNGNKITFVDFLNITNANEVSPGTNISSGAFIIPTSIGSKLFPYSQGGINIILGIQQIILKDTSSLLGGEIGASAIIYKDSNAKIRISIYPKTAMPPSSYNARVEVTFLISDNLAA